MELKGSESAAVTRQDPEQLPLESPMQEIEEHFSFWNVKMHLPISQGTVLVGFLIVSLPQPRVTWEGNLNAELSRSG